MQSNQKFRELKKNKEFPFLVIFKVWIVVSLVFNVHATVIKRQTIFNFLQNNNGSYDYDDNNQSYRNGNLSHNNINVEETVTISNTLNLVTPVTLVTTEVNNLSSSLNFSNEKPMVFVTTSENISRGSPSMTLPLFNDISDTHTTPTQMQEEITTPIEIKVGMTAPESKSKKIRTFSSPVKEMAIANSKNFNSTILQPKDSFSINNNSVFAKGNNGKMLSFNESKIIQNNNSITLLAENTKIINNTNMPIGFPHTDNKRFSNDSVLIEDMPENTTEKFIFNGEKNSTLSSIHKHFKNFTIEINEKKLLSPTEIKQNNKSSIVIESLYNDINEIKNTSVSDRAYGSKGKYYKDENNMTIPNTIEDLTLASTKNISLNFKDENDTNSLTTTTDTLITSTTSAENNLDHIETISTKLLMDWSQILKEDVVQNNNLTYIPQENSLESNIESQEGNKTYEPFNKKENKTTNVIMENISSKSLSPSKHMPITGQNAKAESNVTKIEKSMDQNRIDDMKQQQSKDYIILSSMKSTVMATETTPSFSKSTENIHSFVGDKLMNSSYLIAKNNNSNTTNYYLQNLNYTTDSLLLTTEAITSQMEILENLNFTELQTTTSKSIDMNDRNIVTESSDLPNLSTQMSPTSSTSHNLENSCNMTSVFSKSKIIDENFEVQNTTQAGNEPEHTYVVNIIDQTQKSLSNQNEEEVKIPTIITSTLKNIIHPVDTNFVEELVSSSTTTYKTVPTKTDGEYSIHITSKVLEPISTDPLMEHFPRTTSKPYYLEVPDQNYDSTFPNKIDYNIIIAICVSVIGIIALILLVVFLYVMRKRQKQFTYGQRCRPVSLDAYSLDNVSVYNSVRRKGVLRASKLSYGNIAFDDPFLKHNLLNANELITFTEKKLNIYEEFKNIPQIIARPDEVPAGCEDKNRYANVIPLPETRVTLQRQSDDEKTEYINANFVRGPKDWSKYYIACQGPLENTILDFWRMIWEQNSRVIIMATDLIENGQEKCVEYFPTSIALDNYFTHGDFQITLKSREVKEKYVVSVLHLKNSKTNVFREITHFWYQWPEVGVPSNEASIIAMLLEARSHLKMRLVDFIDEDSKNKSVSIINNDSEQVDNLKSSQKIQSPLTVHCSSGTGRTGTIIACDITLRSLETPKRSVDIPQIVYYVRRGRASSVQTKEQYEFIYRVANVYATKIIGSMNDN